jgi:ATP diphosphatase
LQPTNRKSLRSDELVLQLLEIMKQLRDKDTGCPWDKLQTFDTISKYTIEEAYEVIEAISNKDWANLKEELGDLLLQVVYHSQIAAELNLFDFNEVVEGISNKMISRHPHVFGSNKLEKSISQQIIDWELIKDLERKEKQNNPKYLLDSIPKALPALVRAEKLQKRAAKVEFDWPRTSDVLDKLNEESLELVDAIDKSNQMEIEEEVGDLLFTMVNLARRLEINPEQALTRTNDKFRKRLNGIEDELRKTGKTLNDVSSDDLEILWEAQKKNLKYKLDY